MLIRVTPCRRALLRAYVAAMILRWRVIDGADIIFFRLWLIELDAVPQLRHDATLMTLPSYLFLSMHAAADGYAMIYRHTYMFR